MISVVTDDMFHPLLIRRLGGKAKIAAYLDLDRDAVTKWHTRGIPARYWHRIIHMARSQSIFDVTPERLEATKPGMRFSHRLSVAA